jgi:hypothetical protein
MTWCQFHQNFTRAFLVRKCFSLIQLGFVHFWQKNVGTKTARRMLMKLNNGGSGVQNKPKIPDVIYMRPLRRFSESYYSVK